MAMLADTSTTDHSDNGMTFGDGADETEGRRTCDEDLDRRKSVDCDYEEPGEEDQEESCLLGIDCNEVSTVGLVLRIYADTKIHLDGDG